MNHVRVPHPKSGVEPEGKVIPMAAYRLSKGGAPTCLGDPDFRRAYQDAGAEIGRINILVLDVQSRKPVWDAPSPRAARCTFTPTVTSD